MLAELPTILSTYTYSRKICQPTPTKGGTMFGLVQVTKLFELSKLESVDEAVAKLLEFAEYPKIFRWFQFPTALVVLVAHADCPDSGAVYVYDRKQCVWLWVDFNDQNYGGDSPPVFDAPFNKRQ